MSLRGRSFLEGITTERTSTSMSTVVPMPSKASQPVTRPMQSQPPQEGQEQVSESTVMDGQQGEAGDAPASSSQTEQAEVTEALHSTTAEAEATRLSMTLWLLLKNLTEAVLRRLQQSILHSLQLLDPQWVGWSNPTEAAETPSE